MHVLVSHGFQFCAFRYHLINTEVPMIYHLQRPQAPPNTMLHAVQMRAIAAVTPTSSTQLLANVSPGTDEGKHTRLKLIQPNRNQHRSELQ
jgi:hypothetical protein